MSIDLDEQERPISIRVKRYRPGKENAPFYQTYSVPYRNDMVVLDALTLIKDRLDGSLTFRWSCRMGVCGSCGAIVNGVPRLTCETFLSELGTPTITVEPLNNFPVVKDLVVDIADFLIKLEDVKPWIIRSEEKPVQEGEYLQTPEQMQRYHQLSMCINCMLCYSACPVYGADRKFIGPAASALALRYILDSRDEGRYERLESVTREAGIFDCTFVGECTTVCPKDVAPSIAIQKLKIESSVSLLKSLLLPKARK